VSKRTPLAGRELAEAVIMARMAVRFAPKPTIYERAIVALADALIPTFVAGMKTPTRRTKKTNTDGPESEDDQ
jgi:hypothetical protein